MYNNIDIEVHKKFYTGRITIARNIFRFNSRIFTIVFA